MTPRIKGGGFLERGFRPFFLLAGVYAIVAMALWLLFLRGGLLLPGPMDPLSWHAHEMLFGFAGAAVAGFVLTAVPNWTGRLPLSGVPLLLLVLLWAAGRVLAVLPVPWGLAAAVDVAFPVTMSVVVVREVIAGSNWRNLPVGVALSLLAVANAVDWLEWAFVLPDTGLGPRLGIAVLVSLITLIGGRIVPSFTRNWLTQRKAAKLPEPFGRVDQAVLLVTVLALLTWTVEPRGWLVAALLALAGVGNLVRLARWRGLATAAEPLVWILHVGYLFVPLALLLAAASAWRPDLVPDVAALHGLTAGAITMMIVAVMTRATLGHGGRPLHAGALTTLVYGLLLIAAVSRVWAGLSEGLYLPLLLLSGGAWIGGFVLYLLRYGPIQVAPNRTPSGG
ncbi:NnrS family protein [uncultured Rhodospira sp.]|uniref:NnrS family protein n=1 Tax=uncultured Rhodospira sp. TaxID=1936189 RepID=UPI0026271502|nr:NnrS family protein [uncultured Rhodospira sp.]